VPPPEGFRGLTMPSDGVLITSANIVLVIVSYGIPTSQDGDLLRMLLLIGICPLLSLVSLYFVGRDILRVGSRRAGVIGAVLWLLPVVHHFWFFRRGF
jgi:hypothetical protein